MNKLLIEFKIQLHFIYFSFFIINCIRQSLNNSDKLMGCGTSQITNTQQLIFSKPVIWLIGGGPGSNKAKIIQYLIRDYKFKYLSSFQILQFQKQRNGADAEIIKNCISQKKDFPSQLVVRLIKKALASLPPRRFLIDGFPRNKADILQFQNKISSREIIFEKFIHIQVSREKMRERGIQARKGDKKPAQEIEKQIDLIIDQYQKSNIQIIAHFKSKNKVIAVDSTNSEDQAYNELRLAFQNISNFRSINQGDVKVIFIKFDEESRQFQYCNKLIRKYGFNYYCCKDLIQEAISKNTNESKMIQQYQKNNQALPSQALISLIRKKIERKDYNGRFLISGYPRTISDAEQWERSFGWQTQISGYLSFELEKQNLKDYFQKQEKGKSKLSTQEQIVKKMQSYQKNKKIICEYYDKQQKLLKIDSRQQIQFSMDEINRFLALKSILPKRLSNRRKIVFVSTINDEDQNVINSIDKTRFLQINMAYCYEKQIKQGNLYSDLIQSYLSTGNP